MDVNKIDSNGYVNKRDYSVNNTDKVIRVEDKNKDDQSKKEVEVNQKDLKQAVDVANKVLFKNNTHLQFRIHEKTKEVMVKIIDDNTGEVVKEIPPEKMLDMVAKLWEIAGILIDEKR